MKNIGMVVAVEIDSVLSRYGSPLSQETQGGFQVLRYPLGQWTLIVAKSGVGELAVAAASQMLIDRYQVEMIVNFGVVGGLTPEMGETRTCLVEKIVHYDFDLSGIDPVAPGQYPGFDDVYIPVSRSLLEKAKAVHPELKTVICASADKFVDGAENKSRLNKLYQAEICEMEAAGIALTCHRNKVPCLFVKTVSDGIEGGAQEFYAQVQNSSKICLEITEKIITEL